MSELEKFKADVIDSINGLGRDSDLQALSRIWVREVAPYKWAYNFTWMGRPAIQFPNDAWALQEIIWSVRPDLIIETGIAHGGSLVLSASLLALLDLSDAIQSGETLDPLQSSRKVVGIDVDIRAHNREAIESHPMASRIHLLEGSSVDEHMIQNVKNIASSHHKILVLLDSNHTHDHVLSELFAYAELVSVGSYCIVYDTLINDMPEGLSLDRAWGPDNNPKTAVHEFLRSNTNFEIDYGMQNKLLITVAPEGFLRRLK